MPNVKNNDSIERRRRPESRVGRTLVLLAAVALFGVTAQANAIDYSTFHWRKGDARERVLRPTSTHLCWLSGVLGQMRSASVGVNDRSDGNWVLEGRQFGSGDLQAWATCVPYSSFRVNYNGVNNWISGVTWASSGASTVIWVPGGEERICPVEGSATLWWGDAVTFVMGASGDFRGGGERVWIERGTPTTSSRLRVRSECASTGTTGDALSYFAGVPHSGSSPKLWCNGSCTSTKEFAASAKSDERKTVTMAPTDVAACFITSFSGEFNGHGEWVRLLRTTINGRQHWQLQSRAGGGRAYGRAICMRYDQRS